MDYLAAVEAAAAIGGTVISTASAICALTPTPDPATPRGKLYRVVEIAALLVGRAKDSGMLPTKLASLLMMDLRPHCGSIARRRRPESAHVVHGRP